MPPEVIKNYTRLQEELIAANQELQQKNKLALSNEDEDREPPSPQTLTQ